MSVRLEPTPSGSLASLSVKVVGEGPDVLLIHGSAANQGTFSQQLAPLKRRLQVIRYNRRVLPPPASLTIEDHAQDASLILEARAAESAASGSGAAVVCGISLGGIVALALARMRPSLVRALVLVEPPLGPRDDAPLFAEAFVAELEALARVEGPAVAARRFLTTVLDDVAVPRLPRALLEQAGALWPGIHQDCLALQRYRVGYDTLCEVATPTLLLGGARTAGSYGRTLEALAAALPNAKHETIAGAGHLLHAEAASAFNARLLEWVFQGT